MRVCVRTCMHGATVWPLTTLVFIRQIISYETSEVDQRAPLISQLFEINWITLGSTSASHAPPINNY